MHPGIIHMHQQDFDDILKWDTAATSSEVTSTVDPETTGSTWPLITTPLGPGPRKHPKDKAKAKKARKTAKASRRRNR